MLASSVTVRKHLTRLAVLYLVNRYVLLAIGIICGEGSAKTSGRVHTAHIALSIWGAWDSGAYLKMSDHGYISPDGSNQQIGWYPLYPMAIRMVESLTGNTFVSALLVSNLCLLISIVILFTLIAGRLGEERAYLACKYLVFFPSSMVLSGVFSESLSWCCSSHRSIWRRNARLSGHVSW
jgi:hypothetical protein